MTRAGLAVPSITIILGDSDKLVPRAAADALKAMLPPGAPSDSLTTSRAALGLLLSLVPLPLLLLLLLPGVPTHEVSEASHQMMQEQPEACIAIVERFLAGCA